MAIDTAFPAHPLPDRDLTVFVFNAGGTLLGSWVDVTSDVRFSARTSTAIQQETIDLLVPRRVGAADEANEPATLSTMTLGNRVDVYITSWRTLGGMQIDAPVGGGRDGGGATSLSRLLWSGTINAIGRRPNGYRVVVKGSVPSGVGAGMTHILHEAMLLDYELEVSQYQAGQTYTGWALLAADQYDIDAIKVGDTVRISAERALNPASDTRTLAYEDQTLTIQSLEWSFAAVRLNFSVPFPDLVLEQIGKLVPLSLNTGTNKLTSTAEIVTSVLTASTKLAVAYAVAATTPGSVVNKVEIFDNTGASLGFLPVYSTIT